MKSGRKKIAHQREKRENWCKCSFRRLKHFVQQNKLYVRLRTSGKDMIRLII